MATCQFENHSEETVVHQLNELFGNVLNLDVIKTVAVSVQYDVTKASNRLLEISSCAADGKTGSVDNSNLLFSQKDIATKRDQSVPAAISPRKSKKTLELENTLHLILKGYKVLIIMRGMPGSGKSFLAKNILESTIGYDINHKMHILSTDDYFCQNREGIYNYDSKKLDDAHNWNQRRAFVAMSRGFSPVIIDNTNTQMWEMQPYATMATDYGYILQILEPNTHWAFNADELAKRNKHNVSRVKIKEMIGRYEKNISPQKLLSAYNLFYKLQKPPQMRLYPPPNINVDTFTNINNNTTKIYNTNTRGSANVTEDTKGDKCSRVIQSESAAVLNQLEDKSVLSETINLMEFNDDDFNTSATLERPIKSVNDKTNMFTYNQNAVDNILMYSNESSTSKVLQPIQSKKMDVIVIDSSDEDDAKEPQKPGNTNFPDIESAWGINENILKSWDIVTPLVEETNFIINPQQNTNAPKLVTNDSCSNTEDEYFRLLRNDRTNIGDNSVKILETVNRDINRLTPKRDVKVLKKLMLDKSCMTDDIYDDYENHMSQLISLFPSVPVNHLKYWYNKCKGDLEWTIEFLLEAKEEINSLIDETSMVVEESEELNHPAESESSSSSPDESLTKESKFKSSLKSSEESTKLKKLIESKIDISGEHYSKHLLKIKNFRFGNGNNNNNSDSQKPSTSEIISKTENEIILKKEENDSKSSTSKATSYEDDEDDIIIIDSDMEIDEVDIRDETGKAEQKPEETIELNLGEHFVTQLEGKFADPNIDYPKGFQPVVQVPISLARQLYTFYIESVYQQMETQKLVMETLTKEDEEFARKLQAKEQQKVSVHAKPTTPSFKEIIDEQVAQSIYQKEVDQCKELNPDNLAARLTRQKLFDSFPTINQDVIVEILYSVGNKYKETVDILLDSTHTGNIRDLEKIKEPPISNEVLEEMKEAQETYASQQYDQLHAATFYREEANKYLKRRARLYEKAQQYCQRGMTEVAQFYSGLASKQTNYFDRANGLAAHAFLDEHSKKLEDFNTLDLHFLYVKEAMPALDLFLDRSINLLRLSSTKTSEYLQIITGRGNRSENGISKIKPAVEARLRKRKINFKQLNPGLLKVKVSKTTLVTSEILAV